MSDIQIDMADLQRFIEAGGKAVQEAIKMMATEVWGGVMKEAPVDHGRLAGSFQLEQTGEVDWRISSNVEYALAVHEGTSARRIYPTNARALRFEVGGQEIFAKWVDHPGTAPNPYADRAIDKARGRADEFMQLAMQQAGL